MPEKARLILRIVTVAAVTLCRASVQGEGDLQPTNDLPNPYQTIAPWGKLPDEGRGGR